ncbi:MAG: hypothetical protein ACP5NF_10030 [Thermoanaerobaculum sp.]
MSFLSRVGRVLAAVGLFPEIGVFGMPALVFAAVALAIRGHDGLARSLLARADLLWPFWIGSGFAFCWKLLEFGAGNNRRLLVIAAVAGAAGIVLVGGLDMVTDPNNAPFVVWPALTLLARAFAGKSPGKG